MQVLQLTFTNLVLTARFSSTITSLTFVLLESILSEVKLCRQLCSVVIYYDLSCLNPLLSIVDHNKIELSLYLILFCSTISQLFLYRQLFFLFNSLYFELTQIWIALSLIYTPFSPIDSYPGPGSLALGWASSPSGAIDKNTCRKCSIDAVDWWYFLCFVLLFCRVFLWSGFWYIVCNRVYLKCVVLCCVVLCITS